MTETADVYDEQAKAYDGFIGKLVPDYHLFNQLISRLIKPAKRVLDLGCGTGNTALSILSALPEARLHCLDTSQQMIAAAKTKLPDNVFFTVGAIEDLPDDDRFDAITSVMVMHNLPDLAARQAAYDALFEHLEDGGVYASVDILMAESQKVQELYESQWREFMLKTLPMEEVDGKWLPLHRQKDKPIKLSQQLNMLSLSGFKSVECVHKRFNFALTVAYK